MRKDESLWLGSGKRDEEQTREETRFSKARDSVSLEHSKQKKRDAKAQRK